MEVIKGYSEIKASFPRPILTVGNFDGVHLGHRQIIQAIIDRAKDEKGTSIVYTFRPHPHIVLSPVEELQLINTYDEKLEILSSMGIDIVVEEPFSREFSTISAEKFFKEILLKRLSTHVIYVGYDFGFGKNRAGTLELLTEFCRNEGVELRIAKPLKIEGEICSSSNIRNHIRAGEVTKASALLGREFFYRGLVVRGNGRGRKIGFPTANVHTENKLLVKEGVYATIAICRGRSFFSVTNVGRQPTFNQKGNSPVVVETHILDFNQDIYGETIEVRMVERLRDEMRFSGVESLVAQIRQDVETARRILEEKAKRM